jgi:hypothetical protein
LGVYKTLLKYFIFTFGKQYSKKLFYIKMI